MTGGRGRVFKSIEAIVEAILDTFTLVSDLTYGKGIYVFDVPTFGFPNSLKGSGWVFRYDCIEGEIRFNLKGFNTESRGFPTFST